SCLHASARKAKGCQRCIYDAEVNKPRSARHAICRLSSCVSRPTFCLYPLTSDGNSLMQLPHTCVVCDGTVYPVGMCGGCYRVQTDMRRHRA
ncbi:hypothetical protein JOQ06_025295, partial [Pogonophryne albipinna]